jgi:Zn-dependent protease
MAGRRSAATDATKTGTDLCGAAAADKLSGPVNTRHETMDYSELLALAPMWYVAFLLSLTCHEAAHALVALRGGDPTAFHGGQVTLNPVPHIRREPFGTVLVPILSLALSGWMIGWASAPYDPYWQQRYPHRAAWMALAGPAANLILAVVAGLAIHAGIWMGDFSMPESARFTQVVVGSDGTTQGLALFLSVLFSQNILLMAFNLMPVPPLDGATAIGLLMSEEQALKTLAFLRQPMFSLLGLVLAWNLFGEFFSPVFRLSLSVLYPGSSWGS